MSASEKEIILSILKENASFANFATCDGDQPFVRSVSPIIEDDLSIWIATFCSSRKVQQISQNSKICLSFVQPPQGEKVAIVYGRAEIIPDLEQKKRIWKISPFDFSTYFPDGPNSKELCLLKIQIEKIE